MPAPAAVAAAADESFGAVDIGGGRPPVPCVVLCGAHAVLHLVGVPHTWQQHGSVVACHDIATVVAPTVVLAVTSIVVVVVVAVTVTVVVVVATAVAAALSPSLPSPSRAPS